MKFFLSSQQAEMASTLYHEQAGTLFTYRPKCTCIIGEYDCFKCKQLAKYSKNVIDARWKWIMLQRAEQKEDFDIRFGGILFYYRPTRCYCRKVSRFINEWYQCGECLQNKRKRRKRQEAKPVKRQKATRYELYLEEHGLKF